MLFYCNQSPIPRVIANKKVDKANCFKYGSRDADSFVVKTLKAFKIKNGNEIKNNHAQPHSK
jgi:hypothetical protein